MFSLRVVLDTNIVVSAAMYPEGLQNKAIELVVTKPSRLYVSQLVMDEYSAVLNRSHLKIRKGTRARILQTLEDRAHLVPPAYRLEVAKDPSDNIFLECADKAGADYLVTVNLKHFPAYWKKTKIISTRDFLLLVAPHLVERGRRT